MKILILVLAVFPLVFTLAYGEEATMMEETTPNEMVKVQLFWPEVLPHQLYEIPVKFVDPATGRLLDDVNIEYDLIVTHGDRTIEWYQLQVAKGNTSFEVMFPGGGGTAEVSITIRSMMGPDEGSEMHETVTFNVHMVSAFDLASNDADSVVMEQITPSGHVKVQMAWPEVLTDKLYYIGIKFLDPDTDEVMDNALINYAVAVMQNNRVIEIYPHEYTNNGIGTFEVVFPEGGIGPAQVIIELMSITTDADAVLVQEEISFNVHVVPEFAALAIVVMSIAVLASVIIGRTRMAVMFR